MVKTLFGTLHDGTEISAYTLTNKNNMTVKLTDLGAAIIDIVVPDKNGAMVDVNLGYDTPQEYLDNTCFFGAVIGRSGNRIDKGRFTIDGKTYQLAVNDNENNLHSGPDGYQKRRWDVKSASEAANSITFALNSPDGDQGYPGNFQVTVTYTLTDDNELKLHYEGVCDADTTANMTNHTYFNLSGHDSGIMEDQIMMIPADYFTAIRDGQAIPTGEYAPVEGTPMDFRTAKPIGRDIEADFEQMKFVGGYDHNYVIAKEAGTMRKMAEVYSEKTGIVMEAFTDCCGMQFYAGNCITDHKGKGGAFYTRRDGFCLESQYYPNSINQEGFDSPLLKAGEKYETETIYKFSVK